MKSIQKRLVLPIMFTCILIRLCAQSQTELQVELKFEKDTLDMLEPWAFTVRVTNLGTIDHQLFINFATAGSTGPEIKLEVKDRKSANWFDLKILYNNCGKYERDYWVLKPQENCTYSFKSAPPILFQRLNGKALIRASFSNTCNNPDSLKYFSRPVQVTISGIKGIDKSVVKYLNKNFKFPQTIFHPVVSLGIDTSYLGHCLYILDHFPESTIADYARLCLSTIFLQKSSQEFLKNNQHSSLDFLRLSKKYALEALKSRNPAVVKKAKCHLDSLLGVILGRYKPWPPEEIFKEFEFEFNERC